MAKQQTKTAACPYSEEGNANYRPSARALMPGHIPHPVHKSTRPVHRSSHSHLRTGTHQGRSPPQHAKSQRTSFTIRSVPFPPPSGSHSLNAAKVRSHPPTPTPTSHLPDPTQTLRQAQHRATCSKMMTPPWPDQYSFVSHPTHPRSCARCSTWWPPGGACSTGASWTRGGSCRGGRADCG